MAAGSGILLVEGLLEVVEQPEDLVPLVEVSS
jgi:hypothetical protein